MIRQAMMNFHRLQAPQDLQRMAARLDVSAPLINPGQLRGQVRALLPGEWANRLKGELIRFYRWRQKTLE